jgi:DUF4097 and DUF4098 domain-containing protein YvlB
MAGWALPAGAQQARADGGRQALRAEVVERETRALALGPNGSLTLSNLAGNIIVRTGEGRDVTVEIIRRARGRTEADARRGLEQVTVHVDERANRATVESSYSSERNAPYSVSVAYEVRAPAGTSMSIQSLSGNIDAEGMAGQMTATTTTGDIAIRDARRLSRARSATGRVDLSNVETDGTLEAGTIAGVVAIDTVRARRLVVGTVTGAVTARGASAAWAEVTSTAGDIEYSGNIAPDGRYDLRSHTGDVRFIALGGSGFELRASTFVGRLAPDAGLGLTIIRQEPRELVGTVGDGQAVVTISSFSGNVVIQRR